VAAGVIATLSLHVALPICHRTHPASWWPLEEFTDMPTISSGRSAASNTWHMARAGPLDRSSYLGRVVRTWITVSPVTWSIRWPHSERVSRMAVSWGDVAGWVHAVRARIRARARVRLMGPLSAGGV